jgi:hypothetical protein
LRVGGERERESLEESELSSEESSEDESVSESELSESDDSSCSNIARLCSMISFGAFLSHSRISSVTTPKPILVK